MEIRERMLNHCIKNCSDLVHYGAGRSSSYDYDDFERMPDYFDLRVLLLCHEKKEIREFFKDSQCLMKYYTNNDGRGEWLNDKMETLNFGY